MLNQIWPKSDGDNGWQHSGIDVLSDNRLVFADTDGSTLLYFNLEGGDVESVLTDHKEMHDIVRVNEDGEDFLWISDCGHKFVRENGAYVDSRSHGRVVKRNTRGELIQELSMPNNDKYLEKSWNPTSVAVDPLGKIWVADGYGSYLIYRYSKEGKLELTLDGTKSGLPFNRPHGIEFYQGHLIVADRANKRIVYFDIDGNFIRVITDAEFCSPSSFAVVEDGIYVTELHGAITRLESDGSITCIQRNDRHETPGWPNGILNNFPIRAKLEPHEINSPHGICSHPNGNIYFTEWLIGGRVMEYKP